MGLAALVYRSLAICIRLPTVSFCFFTSRNKPQAVRCYSPRTWSHDNDAFVRRPGLGLLEKPTARRGLDSARSCSPCRIARLPRCGALSVAKEQFHTRKVRFFSVLALVRSRSLVKNGKGRLKDYVTFIRPSVCVIQPWSSLKLNACVNALRNNAVGHAGRYGANCRDALNAITSKRFHQSSIKPSKMSLNTPKPPKRKFLTMLRITFGGLGSFRLKAIRNRQVASSTLALGSIIPLEDKDLADSLNCLCPIRCKVVPNWSSTRVRKYPATPSPPASASVTPRYHIVD